MSIYNMPCIFECTIVRKEVEVKLVEITAKNITETKEKLGRRYFLKPDESWKIKMKRRLTNKEVPEHMRNF